MGWQTDQPVVSYLERRVKYYEKEYRKYSRMAENPKAYYSSTVGNRMSMKMFKKLSAEFAYKKSLRITEYKHAIAKLNINDNT